MKTPLILISSLTLAFVLSISTNLSAQTNTNPQTTKSPVKQTVTQTAKKPVAAKPVAKPALPVAPPAVAAPTNEQIIKEFESYVGKVQKEWMIPGMAVSVMKDGKLVFAKGFGVKDINGKLPVDENTVFQIGSVSKSFTAAVMASLVDEGKIKWDDTVKNILPDFKLYDKWVEENIQVKDIMIHRTGIKGQQGTYIPNLGYSRDDVYKMFPLLKPGYSFRGAYEYNNITFIIAQKIIEKLTGKSWEDNVRERVFMPLGMVNSTLNGDGFLAAKNVSVPHELSYEKGAIINDTTWTDSLSIKAMYGEEQAPFWLTVVGPAGSVVSSATDMAKYIQFHLDKGKVNGKEVISRKNMNYLHRGQTITSQDSTRTTLYGQCWFIEQNSRYRLYFHTGTTWGFTTLAAFVPELNLGLVVLVNSEAPDSPRYALMRRLIDLYKGYPTKDYSKEYFENWKKSEKEGALKAVKQKKELVVKPAPDKALLTGVYDKGELFGKAVVTLEGEDLYITVGPQGWKHKLIHKNGNDYTFRSDGHGFPITFELNGDGKTPASSIDINFGYGENFGKWNRL